MFSRSAELSACALFQAGFRILLYLILTSGVVIADWNTGITIEDVATRIAVNVVDDGVQVNVDLAETAVAQLHSGNSDDSLSPAASGTAVSLEVFAKRVIRIKTSKQLIPIINTSRNTSTSSDLENGASGLMTEVFFPFSGDRPEQLHIAPVFKVIEKAGDKYIITVSHHGLPIIDHGVLTGPETLRLNWQDPWYSHFLNPELKRGHSDPVMAFLYIEPQLIKTEIVVRVKEMASWTELGLRDDVNIYPDEFASIKQKIGRFLLAQNQLSADANALLPALDRVDYIRMGPADIQAYQPQQAQRQVATLIGVSMVHQIKALPEKVQWQWNLFNEKIQRVAIRAYDPAGLFDSYVTRDYRVFEWENMLADIDIPELTDLSKPVAVSNDPDATSYYWLSAVAGFLVLLAISFRFVSSRLRNYTQVAAVVITLAGGYFFLKNGGLVFGEAWIKLDEEQVRPLLKQLLWNVYQAFESVQEDAAYDQLAYSVSGDLRETLYLQNRKALLIEDGGKSKVKRVEIQRLTDLSSKFGNNHWYDCEWLVVGEVIHWGHQHRRENLYRANIKIAPIQGNWKIVELESIAQQRVDAAES